MNSQTFNKQAAAILRSHGPENAPSEKPARGKMLLKLTAPQAITKEIEEELKTLFERHRAQPAQGNKIEFAKLEGDEPAGRICLRTDYMHIPRKSSKALQSDYHALIDAKLSEMDADLPALSGA